MKKALFFVLWILLCIVQEAKAFHIVGGEITYNCIGNNQYEVKLVVYRDCYCVNCADFDNPAYIYIYNNDDDNFVKRTICYEGREEIAPPDIICASSLPDVCVEKAEYHTVINVANNNSGYTLVYQRYSRNSTIVNIFAPDQTGSTYYTTIPPNSLAPCNNSAEFNEFPPTVICANVPMLVNSGATDADGDSLVYEFCSPVIGGNDGCPQPGADGSPNPCNVGGDNNSCLTFIDSSPPPYDFVNWISPYNGGNPLGGSPQIVIDPQTGLITGTPTQVGQYVVGICVSEYRNGELINTVRRDFQFNVTPCSVVQAAVQADQIDVNGNFIITDCGDYSVQFNNISIGADTYFWDFGDLTATDDVSTDPNPSYIYPDSGRYYITLIAHNGNQCVDTAIIQLNLYPTLTPDFSFISDCAYVPVQLTDLSTTTFGVVNNWYWDFGDGTGNYGQNQDHLYAAGGTYSVMLRAYTDLGCAVEVRKDVYVKPVPAANFIMTEKCPEQPIIFSDISTGATVAQWQWDFGNPADPNDQSTLSAPSYTYITPGNYTATLIVTSNEGCKDTIVANFVIYPPFEADAGLGGEICVGDTLVLAGSDAFPWFIYQWSPPESLLNGDTRTPSVFPTTTTTYTATVSDPNGCSATDAVVVTVNPLPTVDISGDTLLCLGDLAQLHGSVGSNVTNYTWTSSGGYTNSTTLHPTLAIDTSTVFVLQAIDNKNCDNTDTLSIRVINPVIAAIAQGDAEICVGEEVELSVSGGTTYSWSPANSLNNANIPNPTAAPLSTTTYIVTVANECFSDVDTIVVTVNPLPIVDAGVEQTINIGETAVLLGSSNGSIAWTPAATLNFPNIAHPTATPLYTTTYTLSSLSDKGCANADSTTVYVTNEFDILVPNAFSPNEDDVNDIFSIFHTKGIKSLLRFSIYNRWGQKIFETNSFEQGWDGNYKGIPQEMGVYAYFIEGLTFLDTPFAIKGNVSLVR